MDGKFKIYKPKNRLEELVYKLLDRRRGELNAEEIEELKKLRADVLNNTGQKKYVPREKSMGEQLNEVDEILRGLVSKGTFSNLNKENTNLLIELRNQKHRIEDYLKENTEQ